MNCCFLNFVGFLKIILYFFEIPLFLPKWPSDLSFLSKVLGRLLFFVKEERRPAMPSNYGLAIH